jgi:hypothetical protein
LRASRAVALTVALNLLFFAGLLASARKYNSALVNEEMLHQVADPYMQLRRLIKRNEVHARPLHCLHAQRRAATCA